MTRLKSNTPWRSWGWPIKDLVATLCQSVVSTQKVARVWGGKAAEKAAGCLQTYEWGLWTDATAKGSITTRRYVTFVYDPHWFLTIYKTLGRSYGSQLRTKLLSLSYASFGFKLLPHAVQCGCRFSILQKIISATIFLPAKKILNVKNLSVASRQKNLMHKAHFTVISRWTDVSYPSSPPRNYLLKNSLQALGIVHSKTAYKIFYLRNLRH